MKGGLKSWNRRALDPQDQNHYTYVQNNPLNVIDVGGYSGARVRKSFWNWWAKKQQGPLWQRALTFGAVVVVAAILAFVGALFILGGLFGGGLGPALVGTALVGGAVGGTISAATAFGMGASPDAIAKSAGVSAGIGAAAALVTLGLRALFVSIFSSGTADGGNGLEIQRTASALEDKGAKYLTPTEDLKYPLSPETQAVVFGPGEDFTLVDAWKHYTFGEGKPVWVDASSVDVGSLSASDFANGAGSSINVKTQGSDFYVYGTLKATLSPSNSISLGPDFYNFDIKPWSSVTWKRNLLTIGGQYLHPYGKPYSIHFYGTVPVTPP